MIDNLNTLLFVIMAIPLFGIIFAGLSKENSNGHGHNVLAVGIFTVLSNLVVLWITARKVDFSGGAQHLSAKFEWLAVPKIELIFELDFFSLLLIAAVHLAVLLGFIGVRNNNYRQKTLVIFALMFLEMITGYFFASDLFSFYIFFEAMLLPLFMLVGIFGDSRRQDILYRFFLYNLLGAMLLFVALCILFNSENILIREMNRAVLSKHLELLVWVSIFIAFLSRIPIWPFHYWLSSVNVNISNPLVFIIANIMPLTGVYGLIRFSPLTAPEILEPYLLFLEIVSITTMFIIALIGFSNRDIQYKIFSYMTVYYILYLLGALLPTDALLANIGFSLFAYLIVTAAIEIIVSHLEKERMCNGLNDCGILCSVPRSSFVLSFFILAAVGLPLSSLFLNNMLIFAGLVNYNLKMAIFILSAIILSSLSLLQHLFYLRYPQNETKTNENCIEDISLPVFMVFALVMVLLVVSFVNPLWYME